MKLARYADPWGVDIRQARVQTHSHRRLERAGVVGEIGEDHIHPRARSGGGRDHRTPDERRTTLAHVVSWVIMAA
jgi:hypothetical protein